MAATHLISARHRENPNQIASAADFTLAPEGACDLRRVSDDPACTLYCLDPARQQALFVETPPGLDPYDGPFLYQAQFQHAGRVVTLSYEELLAAAGRTSPPCLSFLYSVGRCGSTLLGRALHAMPDVLCLAEPEALMGCIGRDRPEILGACVRLQCKPGPRKRPTSYVVKTRHWGIRLAAPLQRLFPASRALFVYRDAITYVGSALRAFHPLPASVREYHADPVRFMTRQWLSVMQQHLALHRDDAPIRAVRYEDLKERPRELFPAICRWLELAAPDLARTDEVFARDSQGESNLARDSLAQKSIRELGSTADIERKVRETLAAHPEISRPDFVAPGTMGSGQ